jgi:hypothetical protein
MPSPAKSLGIMKPLGGGDPIPLHKEEVTLGRRPTCDVQLDYENVSGKHCILRFAKGVWHVRDLGSTNGTTLNGQKISSEHGLLPDDELGIAGHLFMIDYEPIAPTQVMAANQVLEEEMAEGRRHHSLLELAGLETDTERPSRRNRPERAPTARPARPSVDEADFDDALPRGAEAPLAKASDDDFFNLIKESVVEDPKAKKKGGK